MFPEICGAGTLHLHLRPHGGQWCGCHGHRRNSS
jgi:hypothetical protein